MIIDSSLIESYLIAQLPTRQISTFLSEFFNRPIAKAQALTRRTVELVAVVRIRMKTNLTKFDFRCNHLKCIFL